MRIGVLISAVLARDKFGRAEPPAITQNSLWFLRQVRTAQGRNHFVREMAGRLLVALEMLKPYPAQRDSRVNTALLVGEQVISNCIDEL